MANEQSVGTRTIVSLRHRRLTFRALLRRPGFKTQGYRKDKPIEGADRQNRRVSPAPLVGFNTPARGFQPLAMLMSNGRSHRLHFRALLLALLVMATFASWHAAAQEATPETTQAPAVDVQPVQTAEPPIFADFQPKTITSGLNNTLSVFGSNFPEKAAVAIQGIGILPTTFVNANALTATLPESIAAGTYDVFVIVAGMPQLTCECSEKLTVNPPIPTQAPPQPTQEPPPPQPTSPPPTIAPGAPSLLIRSFTANPTTIAPGGTTTFNVEIVNVGTRGAEGLSVSLDSGSKFIPANGQATILLPNIAPNAGTVMTLPVTAAEDAASGPQSVPITMTYRDFTGESYTAKGALTVSIEKVETASQVTLTRYLFDPASPEPGKPVTVTILLTNTGNGVANQVLIRIGEGGILLAGPQGDSFPVGDLDAGQSASIEMPLIVSSTAKPGPQPQGFSIGYLQDGEAKTITSSVTVDVAKLEPTAPVMLLNEFDVGRDVLQPGEQFTATVTLKNVGKEAAENMLLTFGTVSQSSPPSSGDGSGDGSGSGSGTGSGTGTTNPSTTFAPVGSGGTAFIGTVDADGGTATLTQDFIVNGSVDTGIFTLPITLRYQKADGTTVTDVLNASLVVVLPPRLSIELQSPLPEDTNIGEPLMLTVGITNRGRKTVNFNTATVTTDNGEVVEGAETVLGALRTDDDTSITTNVIPSDEGTVKITLTLNYTDDLNKPQEIVKEYELQAVQPPPMPTFEPPPDFANPLLSEEQNGKDDDTLGKLLLGLLGLGS